MATHKSTEKEGGLLTRFVPARLRSSRIFGLWLKLTRLMQALSSIISLGTFSSRIYKVYRLVNSVKRERGLDTASQAVEGILAAAVAYTVIATLFMCITKRSSGGPKWLRWVWVLLDLLFVIAFIVVAVLTSPNGGQAGPFHCYSSPQAALTGPDEDQDDDSCKLPWATFVLAIVSTFLHAITAAFHEAKDHRHKSHDRKMHRKGNRNSIQSEGSREREQRELEMHNGSTMHHGNMHDGSNLRNGHMHSGSTMHNGTTYQQRV